MSAKKMKGVIKYLTNLSGSVWLVGIEMEEVASFVPGQFVSLKVNEEGLRRSYSVASLPNNKNIELVVDVAPMGVGSKFILSLSVGDEIEVLGFLGKFVVEEKRELQDKQYLFVATGVGVVPLKPMIEDLLKNKSFKSQVHLVWGMRYETDLFWLAEFDKLQREYDNFHFEIALSRPNEDWPKIQGHVGDVVSLMNIKEGNTLAYLCGNPEMIMEIKELLISREIPEEQIFYERFA